MAEAGTDTYTESAELRFPWAEPPAPGEPVEVAPGILWVRFPLPFRLDHVNIYLIEDEGGYAVLDTGISNDQTREHWRALMDGPLAGKKLTRLIVTHFHPDHIGLAGWLCETYGLPLLTSQTSYLMSINISLTPGALAAKPYQDFYLRHGMSPETAKLVSTQGHAYLSMVDQLPPTFLRLVAGDTLTIGRRQFRVYTGDGHAPEQIMLYLADERILFAADQVIAKITPNISVWAVDPEGDPLGHYLRTVRLIEAHIPDDALVLPGHQLPFYGLHTRCQELVMHHEDRCQAIGTACADGPKTVADLVPVLFRRELDPHQLSFAFSETHAHVNRMVRRGELVWIHEAETSRVAKA
ncbi:MBL fold metallo-hydrolase [Amorphus orientalis]|uniref:Glyoxylase-like metal-dependent hydrolase (Beta-lactamase superfamily II) n=1 Tax=Amorphus orientalis TaxID=649198 RepID=A0AAE4ARZ0_9HYPH|nr:MBL fold metallo-hydrolase [Amorphus orientalis]MDQ0314415.1 glyoxylase-like metal-dependent hydrolase (beta-lactamase superfamily II) [Amorphus orientalis]